MGIFLRKNIQISWLLAVFSKLKKNCNIRKNSDKIHMHSDKLTNQFWSKKKLGFRFFCWKFFFSQFVNNFLELSIYQMSFLITFRTVDFFKYFYPFRKYSKYSLNLTFCWPCNDTLVLKTLILFTHLQYHRTLSTPSFFSKFVFFILIF